MIVLTPDLGGALRLAGISTAAPEGSTFGPYAVRIVERMGALMRAIVLDVGQSPDRLPGFRRLARTVTQPAPAWRAYAGAA